MAQSPNLDDLLAQIPIGEIASRFGVDEATAESAVKQALPGLLGGMAFNASTEEGAGKLEQALAKHETSGSAISLDAVDEADGEKIVGHVLGDRKTDVANALGAQAGDSGIAELIPKLLPLLAPIIMQFLANGMGGKQQDGSGGGIGDLLGGLLGGGNNNSGGGLGDLLGGLLGGGGNNNSGGGLGGLLGGLLGNK